MTEIPLLTKERALELLEEVVAEAGTDYVYESQHRIGAVASCVYVQDGQPSCIVGRAMAKHGVPIERLADWDNYGMIYEVNQSFISPDALHVLREAQVQQDIGTPWGECVAVARNETTG